MSFAQSAPTLNQTAKSQTPANRSRREYKFNLRLTVIFTYWREIIINLHYVNRDLYDYFAECLQPFSAVHSWIKNPLATCYFVTGAYASGLTPLMKPLNPYIVG